VVEGADGVGGSAPGARGGGGSRLAVASPTTTARPMTGEEYLASLRDGRQVWIYGEPVGDVTTHPAFRNSARSVARLYDALHDPAQRDVLTCETDTGNGGFTHPFFRAPRSADDLVRGRDAIAAWQRLTYGWMGRSPDYKAAFLATYGPNADYYAPYEENARRWYRESQERVFFMNHTLVNPPVDRNRDIHEVDDVFIHAVGETDEGVIVRGAKMVATGSAISNYNFVSYHGALPIKKQEYALSFFAPMSLPGTKLICRPSYELQAAMLGSPFDYPLSSRFDENDAVLVFEDAVIPWENFLIYGNLEIASTYHLTGFIWRALMQGCTRLAVKLDFLAGLFVKVVEAIGTAEFRGIQASIGEILAWRNMFWSLTDAMCHNPVAAAGGSVLPNIEAASAYRILSNQAYPIIKGIIENQTGGALIVHPSSARDWKREELRPLLDQFYRGSTGYPAVDKIKLVKLLWDAIGSEFGGRHELYERSYSGSHELTKLEAFWMAQADGTVDRIKAFAEACMAEYDLDGWTVPDLINPDDVSVAGRSLGPDNPK
jgi:4-hydroxyphenylacetate 3-monooxygenase